MKLYNSVDRQIFRLAIPALGALAAEPLVSLVDTAFVGHLGADELAALGVVTAIFHFSYFLIIALAYAETPLISQAVGAGDYRRAQELVYQSLVVAVMLGVLGLAVMEGAATLLVRLIGTDPQVEGLAVGYLRIRGLALPALMFITVGHGVYRGVADTKTPMLVTLVASFANLVLDPMMIFWWGWGLNGAAIASVAAQWGSAVIFLVLIFKGHTGLKVLRARLHLSAMRMLLGAGSALTLRTLALVTTFTLAAASAARLGVVEIASYQVSIQIFLFLSLVIDAVAIAAQSLIASRLGSGDIRGARILSSRMLLWGFCWGVLLAAAIWLPRETLVRWFTSDPEVIAVVLSLIPFVAFLQPLTSVVYVLDGILIGAGRFRFLAAAMIGACLPTSVMILVAPTIAWLWWAIVFLTFARMAPLTWRYLSGL